MTTEQKIRHITSAQNGQKSRENLNKKKKTVCSHCKTEITNDNNTSLCDACNEYYGTEN